MRRTLIPILLLALAAPALAQVPNRLEVVERLAKADPARFACAHTPASCGYDFIRALACELHQEDARWGMNGRRGDPKAPSWDALNWKGFGPGHDPTNGNIPITVIDVIASAGSPAASPAWIVFSSDPTAGAWIQPVCGPAPAPIPPPGPVYPPYPPDESAVDGAGLALILDFAEAGQPHNQMMFRFAFRVAYSWLTKEVPDLPASVAKHRKEWRALLGLPPLP